MLMIRLQRIGKKHQPAYRLVVGEKRNKLRGGKQLEDLGWFNPVSDKSDFNKDRITHWLKMGAQPSDTVHNLLVGAKIVEGKKIAVHKSPKAVEGAVKPEEKKAEVTAEAK